MVKANKGKEGGSGVGVRCGGAIGLLCHVDSSFCLVCVCMGVVEIRYPSDKASQTRQDKGVVGWSHRLSLLRGLEMVPAGGAQVSALGIAPAHEESCGTGQADRACRGVGEREGRREEGRVGGCVTMRRSGHGGRVSYAASRRRWPGRSF